MTVIERFAAKFSKSESSDCWVWNAASDRYGYGRFKLNGKMEKAHRVSYSLFVGELIEGMDIDHTCTKGSLVDRIAHRKCCNPEHLEQVTHQVNIQRIYAR